MDFWWIACFTAVFVTVPATAGPSDSDQSDELNLQPLSQSPIQPPFYVRTTLEAALASFFGLPDGSSLTRVRQLSTKRRTSIVKLRQQVGSVEVYDSIIVAETNAEGTQVLDVTSRGILRGVKRQQVVKPTVSPSDALDATSDAFHINDRDMVTYSWNQRTRLVYYPAKKATKLRLCYLADFIIHRPRDAAPFSPHAVVDAVTGKVLLSWNGLAAQKLVAISGVGGNNGAWGLQRYTDLEATRQSDNVTCRYNTPSVKVQNLRSATSGTFVDWSFTCADAVNATKDAINGGYSPLNDVARHSKITLDMYLSYLGVSPTGSLPLLARVHYGINFENSFWDGTQINIGDGSSSTYPLTALEIIAHEYSHAFTSIYSGLQYRDQPGGINEAFSDMAGEAAKFYSTNSSNFLVASQITKSGLPLRYMCDPTRDGRSIGNASKFVAGMDPHYSSGVYNKAFCLLAKTPGWDTVTAFQIFAFANAVYWSQLTGFTAGACGVQKAAIVNGLSASDVAAAFSAVGVKC